MAHTARTTQRIHLLVPVCLPQARALAVPFACYNKPALCTPVVCRYVINTETQTFCLYPLLLLSFICFLHRLFHLRCMYIYLGFSGTTLLFTASEGFDSMNMYKLTHGRETISSLLTDVWRRQPRKDLGK